MSHVIDYALLAGAFFIVLKARQTYKVLEHYVEKISNWEYQDSWNWGEKPPEEEYP